MLRDPVRRQFNERSDVLLVSGGLVRLGKRSGPIEAIDGGNPFNVAARIPLPVDLWAVVGCLVRAPLENVIHDTIGCGETAWISLGRRRGQRILVTIELQKLCEGGNTVARCLGLIGLFQTRLG